MSGLEKWYCFEKEIAEKNIVTGKRWGPWRYYQTRKYQVLELKDKKGRWLYEVDLRACKTSDHILDRLCQILRKAWSTPEIVAYLLAAIDELAGGLQPTVCFQQRDPLWKQGA